MFYFDGSSSYSSQYADTGRRGVSTAFRLAEDAQATGDVILIFVTISHPTLVDPIRVVSEDEGGVSYFNGAVVNYRYDGNLYLGCPFKLTFVTDNDQPAQAQVTVPNVDRVIGEKVLGLTSPPTFDIAVMMASNFDDLYDEDNARNPIGTPDIDVEANFLFLRNVKGNVMQLTGDLMTYDIGNEPYPPIRTIKSKTPALYR